MPFHSAKLSGSGKQGQNRWENSGSGPARSQLGSPQAILKPATAEFGEKGFSGARIETIGRRAGYHKSLIYRYYKSKKGLFDAVLEERPQQRGRLADQMPPEFAVALEQAVGGGPLGGDARYCLGAES